MVTNDTSMHKYGLFQVSLLVVPPAVCASICSEVEGVLEVEGVVLRSGGVRKVDGFIRVKWRGYTFEVEGMPYMRVLQCDGRTMHRELRRADFHTTHEVSAISALLCSAVCESNIPLVVLGD